MPRSILLYRYLPAEAAIKTIEGRALRVSRLRELNDPFEWIPGLDPVQPQAAGLARWCMDHFLAELNDTFGILSFSESVRDSVLWSHYACSHRGIALEVDHIIDDSLHTVVYTDDRPVIDPRWIHDRTKEQELVTLFKGFWYRKSTGWSYEKERRVVLDLKTCHTSNGMFFKSIPDGFLKRVILGARCDVGTSYARRALDLNGFSSVQVVQASLNNRTYEIKC